MGREDVKKAYMLITIFVVQILWAAGMVAAAASEMQGKLGV